MRTLPPPGAPAPFFWRCAACRRHTPFGYDELLGYARGAWPVCCGQTVMGGRVGAAAADRADWRPAPAAAG